MAGITCTMYLRPEGDILSVDANFEEVFGFTNLEVIGRKMEEVIIPVGQRGLYALMAKGSKETGKPSLKDILCSIVQLQDKRGDSFPVRVEAGEHEVGTSTTFIVKIDKAQTETCTITFDLHGNVIAVSNLSLFGYAEEDIKDMKLIHLLPGLPPMLYHPERDPDYSHLLDPSFWEPSSSKRTQGTSKQGSSIPLKMQIGSFGEGRHTTFCATVLKMSESTQAVVRVDSCNTILDCNSQVSVVFGFSREELVGKSLSSLLSQDGPVPQPGGSKKRKREYDWQSTYKEDILRMTNREGDLIFVNSTSFSIKEEQGAEEEFLIRFSLNDSSEEKRIGPYTVGNLIAEGSFGAVREAVHIRTKDKAAVKIIKKDQDSSSEKVSAVRELHILRTLNHPNIVQLLDAFETKEKLFIITEYVDGHSLNTVISDALDFKRARSLFKQVISAVQYCHAQGIFHRDIKPSNILVTSADDTIKLIDFGVSNVAQLGKLQSTFCGSPAFAAPEIILGQKYIGMAADVWSLGVLLHFMVAKKLPFEKVKDILGGGYKAPQDFDADCADLLHLMLNNDPEKRATIETICKHPFIVDKDTSETT